ncbi:MAG: hypothetical protein Q7R49_00775 [Candidatus Daviesbacteria bacterium]|nr:hypothetical protein [Candidatus Daviesbacteria bacterium]
MDFLQLALIFLIIVLTVFLGLGGYMVFLILQDLRADLSKLDTILSKDPAVLEKIKKDVKKSEVTKKSPKIFSQPRRFFKRS